MDVDYAAKEVSIFCQPKMTVYSPVDSTGGQFVKRALEALPAIKLRWIPDGIGVVGNDALHCGPVKRARPRVSCCGSERLGDYHVS